MSECGNRTTEVQRWECIGEHLFAHARDMDSSATYVFHSCYGVGWGNAIRALYNAVSVAAMSGRRLMLIQKAFNGAFLPPNPAMPNWAFGVWDMNEVDGGSLLTHRSARHPASI